MEFKEGTTVYTNDGETVGKVERFVLDPGSRKIIGLVLRKGFLFTEDKVIPISSIATATEDRVNLKPTEGGWDDFPLFEETHYLSPEETELKGYTQPYHDPLYYYPPAGSMMWYGGVMAPVGPTAPAVKERNIPEESVPLTEGANVVSRDGDHVGDVKRVMTDGQSRKVTHFAISQGIIFKEEKIIPINWVDSISEDEVHLAVGTKQLERLDVL